MSIFLLFQRVWGIPGRQNPRIEEKIAHFLDVTTAELFQGRPI